MAIASSFRADRRLIVHAALWLAAATLVTLAMLLVRDQLEKVHVAIGFLLVVLGASAISGRVVGMGIALLTFLCFNFFFLLPYHTFSIDNPLDWLVLIAYLITAATAAHLFYRAQQEAEHARERASEIERLSALGAETLNVGRAEDALASVASVIRTTVDVAQCEVYQKDPYEPTLRLLVRSPRDRSQAEDETVPQLVTWVANEGLAAAELTNGATRLQETAGLAPGAFAPDGAVALIYPLRVRERAVGVLRLAGRGPISLDPAQQRFVEVLSYYAALAVERVRLIAQAEHASALAEADRLKDALLATVSHDLRTPLTTIKAVAHEIAQSGDPRAQTIEEQADRLNELVADLLDVSRLQAGGVKLNIEVNSAEDLIGATLRELSGTLGDRVVDVEIEDAATAIGSFDFVQSLRVLSNLIENAHKYSPAGEPIEVRARRDGNVLVFAVSDRGPGIPNEERHLIYQPFYRGKTTGSSKGTGLGLAIAARIAELQGGVIRHIARSGGGTTFVFRVPAAELPA